MLKKSEQTDSQTNIINQSHTTTTPVDVEMACDRCTGGRNWEPGTFVVSCDAESVNCRVNIFVNAPPRLRHVKPPQWRRTVEFR